MEGHGIGEVLGIQVKLGAADVSPTESDAERTSPRDLGGPGNINGSFGSCRVNAAADHLEVLGQR